MTGYQSQSAPIRKGILPLRGTGKVKQEFMDIVGIQYGYTEVAEHGSTFVFQVKISLTISLYQNLEFRTKLTIRTDGQIYFYIKTAC